MEKTYPDTKEIEEACKMYKSGLLISEVAVKMNWSFNLTVQILARKKLVSSLEYKNITLMPLEWIKEWLEIWKSTGKMGKRI